HGLDTSHETSDKPLGGPRDQHHLAHDVSQRRNTSPVATARWTAWQGGTGVERCWPVAAVTTVTVPARARRPAALPPADGRKERRVSVSRVRSLLVATLHAGALEQLAVLLLRHPLTPLLDNRAHDYPRSLRLPSPALSRRGLRCGSVQPPQPAPNHLTGHGKAGVCEVGAGLRYALSTP